MLPVKVLHEAVGRPVVGRVVGRQWTEPGVSVVTDGAVTCRCMLRARSEYCL